MCRKSWLRHPSLAVDDAWDWVRGQTVSVIEAAQQVIGEFLSGGPCVAALQEISSDNLERKQKKLLWMSYKNVGQQPMNDSFLKLIMKPNENNRQ